MFADYGNPWSLWENAGPHYVVNPADLGIPDTLILELAKWSLIFDRQNFGYGLLPTRAEWLQSGRQLSYRIAPWISEFARIRFEADRW